MKSMEKNVMCIEFVKGLEPVGYLLTHLRNAETTKEKFVHYANRLARFTAEVALAQLHHHQNVTVKTPLGDTFKGTQLDTADQISLVSILR